MNDLTLFNKLPAAAEQVGKSAKAVEDASGLVAATMQKLKDAQKANMLASQSLRDIMEELKSRAAKREGK